VLVVLAAARALDDAVDGNELCDNNLAHVNLQLSLG
jgi:hypothetical protein